MLELLPTAIQCESTSILGERLTFEVAFPLPPPLFPFPPKPGLEATPFGAPEPPFAPELNDGDVHRVESMKMREQEDVSVGQR